MPHEFDYEAAKAIFHGSNLHEVRADGVWLLSENIAPLLTSAERKAFIEHPLDSLWEMGKPSPSSQPVLRIPFTAAELAACFLVGAGALYASERFGEIGLRTLSRRNRKAEKADLEKALQTLDCGPAAKAAVRMAYAELREAAELVGTLEVLHEEDAQLKTADPRRAARDAKRKTAVSRQSARLVRRRLNIDDDLARVNAELEADLSAQQCKLDEKLAPLKAGLEKKDEESIKQQIALRNAAELQNAKSQEAALEKREKILAPFDDWIATNVGYKRLRNTAANAWEEAAEAESAWRKKLVRQLLNSQQVPLPLSGSADDALPDVARAQPEAQTEQQDAKAVGRTALPSDVKEKRKALLAMFRALGGKRPKEGGSRGKRGALAQLKRDTGIHSKNLGELLDRAIEEEMAVGRWKQLTVK